MASRTPKKQKQNKNKRVWSCQEDAEQSEGDTNNQGGTEWPEWHKQIDEGAGLPRESQATKGIENGKEAASTQEG